MTAPLEDGRHHLARAPEGTFASSAGLREENKALREALQSAMEDMECLEHWAFHPGTGWGELGLMARTGAARARAALRLGGGR